MKDRYNAARKIGVAAKNFLNRKKRALAHTKKVSGMVAAIPRFVRASLNNNKNFHNLIFLIIV